MQNFDIYEGIFKYIVNVIKFLNKLPKTPTNLIFINQATRSVTSMGANSQEADGSSSKNAFLNCFTITRKEDKETIFWLKIIKETNDQKFHDEASALIKEGLELVAIISTIMKNYKNATK